MKAARRCTESPTMSRPRKVLFEAINDAGSTKRIAKIQCDYLHGVAWKFDSDDGIFLLPSDRLYLRNNVEGLDLITIKDHGESGSIVFDEPIRFPNLYPNLYTEGNRFLVGGIKRVYGYFIVSAE